MLKKILIFVYIIAFCAIGYFLFHIFFDRYEQIAEEEENIESVESKTDEDTTTQNNSSASKDTKTATKNNDSEDEDEDDTENETLYDTVTEDDAAYTISTDDCDNNCADIDDDDEEAYCFQVCGLNGQNQDSDTLSTDCDTYDDLEKDYCIRNQAVAQTDISMCNSISDSGVRTQCKRRIQEDIMDEIM